MEMQILHGIQNIRTEFLDQLMVKISFLGNEGWFWIVAAILLFLLVKDKRVGLTVAMALIVDLVICNLILKNVFSRERPCWMDPSVQLLIESPKSFSFPSGHTAGSFAAAIAIFMNRKKLGAAALVLASLIAFSRMYLFVHWPTDILGGIVVGLVAASCGRIIVEELAKKFPKIKGKTV